MRNTGLFISEEINNFSNILEATNVLHENGIILEFDASKLKERIIKIINSIIERAKNILRWIKENIIDKVIKAGKKMWDKLTKFNKVQEEVETKIEEAKKSDDPKVEEKVKTIEEQIDDFSLMKKLM